MSQDDSSVVVDRGKSQWSDLYKKEDYWAIWIGFAFILYALFFAWQAIPEFQKKIEKPVAEMQAEKGKPFKTVAFYDAQAAQKKVQAADLPALKALISNLKTPQKWTTNPIDSLILTEADAKKANEKIQPKIDEANAKVKAAKEAALAAEAKAAEAEFKNEELNTAAKAAIDSWQAEKGKAGKLKLKKPFNLIPGLLILGLIIGVLVTFGAIFMGFNAVRFFIGFVGVYFLCLIANILGKQATMGHYGVNAEIWSIVLGMLIANTIGTPKWLKEGAEVEYYIKTGLVLLGAEVLFHKIVAIGIPGIFVAWVVTPIVLITTFIFGQKVLKMPSKTLNIVISADMSVCGTSAAIATAAAARAKKEELTLSVGLSLTFTAIMMVIMPTIIRATGMPEILGGAWIGGTVDATGAVAAAGAFVGPKAMEVAATVKMIQNVLIGVTAFCVALYWTTKVEAREGEKVGLMEIWHRFPKFVIGFLAASILISLISTDLGSYMGHSVVDKGVNSVTKPLRSWFFALAFISIGLTTNFRELGKYFKGGKPIILYVCGQSLNLVLTLLMAWIMFYKVFPEITAKI